jgi:hypothetical protein
VLLLGDGKGGFADISDSSGPRRAARRTQALVCGPRRRRLADLALASAGSGRLLRNRRDGAFGARAAHRPPPAGRAIEVATGDDGDLDRAGRRRDAPLAVPQRRRLARRHRGDGLVTTLSSRSLGLLLDDFDADGRADLYVSNGSPALLPGFRAAGSGAGGAAPGATPFLTARRAPAVPARRLDGDGDRPAVLRWTARRVLHEPRRRSERQMLRDAQ